MVVQTTSGQHHLHTRGILAAAQTFGWQYHDHSQRWYYPAIDPLTGAASRRSKAYDSASRYKYLWHSDDGKSTRKPDTLHYYAPQGAQRLLNAIHNADGTLYIANGEPAVLTVLSAGRENVLSWYGENSAPKTLPADLLALGVKRAIFPADLDPAGRAAAVKVRDLLLDSGIVFTPIALPDTLPAKADLNDLWILIKLSSSDFWAILDACPLLELPPRRAAFTEAATDTFTDTFRPADPASRSEESTWDDVRREVTMAMERTFNIRRYNAGGWSNNFANHWRGEDHPSAGYNRLSGMMKDFAGDCYALRQLAAIFGIDAPQRRFVARHGGTRRLTAAQKAVPIAERVRPFSLRDFPADLTVNERFISNLDASRLPTHGALLVKSDIGTGKTELIKHLIDAFEHKNGYKPSVLALTHRQALARDIARRLGLECYKDFDACWLKSMTQLVSCYNSEYKRDSAGAAAKTFDLVVIDECEQFHAHLGSGTFRGGEALLNYAVVRRTVQAARLVVCLDAHASEISRDWLISLKGSCGTLLNTYTRQHSPLTFYANRYQAMQTAIRLIDEREGVVVIPVGSRKTAHELHSLLSERYGTDAGCLVCGDNSQSAEIQAFIRDINAGIGTLRYLIHTTSLGTGVDITAPVRAVVGIFSAHLAAPEIMQMLGRCRHTRETHAYVPCIEGQSEENWQALYQRHEARMQRTGELCAFEAHNIPRTTPTQQAALKLLSLLDAERNRSRNNLLGHMVALARQQGYPVHYADGDAPEMRQQLKTHAEQLAAAHKTAVLASESIDYARLEQHRAEGTLTNEIHIGHERFIIEDAVGLTMNPSLYDNLHQPTQRERLRRFTDTRTGSEELMESDRDEARNNHLLNKRQHRMMRRDLMVTLINSVFGEEGLDFKDELTGQEIEQRMTSFLSQHWRDLHLYFDRRADSSERPTSVLRWLLQQIGVKIKSHQIMRGAVRFMVYSLDQEHLATWKALAEAREVHLARQKEAAAKSTNINNAYLPDSGSKIAPTRGSPGAGDVRTQPDSPPNRTEATKNG